MPNLRKSSTFRDASDIMKFGILLWYGGCSATFLDLVLKMGTLDFFSPFVLIGFEYALVCRKEVPAYMNRVQNILFLIIYFENRYECERSIDYS